MLSTLTSRIGSPTLYGGSAHGLNIRWRTARQTLVLDHGVDGLQLSVHRTDDLEHREAGAFRRGVGDGPDQVTSFSELPYLWQLYRNGPGAVPTGVPVVSTTPDWRRLHDSLTSLLRALSEQLPTQVGDDAAAFDLVNHADGDRVLSVICGRQDEVTLLIDDQDAPDGRRGREHEMAMRGRGWEAPVLGWWQAWFEPGSAASAAHQVIRELRARGSKTPLDVSATQFSCADNGLLVLPGLGTRHAPARPRAYGPEDFV
ncbi:hypothetical protein [Streptomyces decoyicus]|uniref:hypothetical protein n=1 Tax=Streptomyces decoyicus TaxID=249567 RepID=UPI0036648239